ncbi:RidA family protein [Hyunsoonleella sp. 2307UL5-6]|uniref:RidA family protein n=1 Tax=Hyunsoonleella sp. 2307UL5-6 TaxID=3384768 RepID=UPI0039BD218C
MINIDKTPVPQGKYLAAVRHANIVYTSGMTPRKAGKLMYTGKIKTTDTLESHRDAAELAVLNALGAAQNCLIAGERISVVLQMSVFLNAEENFTKHAKLADFASEILISFLGIKSIGTRAAIGVASLPSNAPIEITLVCKVD